jgi:hypothetical protein
MVSMLVFTAIAIPCAIWRAGVTARRRDRAVGETASETFADWLRGHSVTWTGEQKSSTAIIEVQLPLAAVAFGLTTIGIVFDASGRCLT